jgi:hypothetical protein
LLGNDPCGFHRRDDLEPELLIAIKDQIFLRGFKGETPRTDHDAKIKSVVANVFDPQLRERLIRKAQIPEVNKDDFLELAKDKVKERRSAFLASHPNCYFILGTYEYYFPNRKTALFNLV